MKNIILVKLINPTTKKYSIAPPNIVLPELIDIPAFILSKPTLMNTTDLLLLTDHLSPHFIYYKF